jgi:hypothetical protein
MLKNFCVIHCQHLLNVLMQLVILMFDPRLEGRSAGRGNARTFVGFMHIQIDRGRSLRFLLDPERFVWGSL